MYNKDYFHQVWWGFDEKLIFGELSKLQDSVYYKGYSFEQIGLKVLGDIHIKKHLQLT